MDETTKFNGLLCNVQEVHQQVLATRFAHSEPGEVSNGYARFRLATRKESAMVISVETIFITIIIIIIDSENRRVLQFHSSQWIPLHNVKIKIRTQKFYHNIKPNRAYFQTSIPFWVEPSVNSKTQSKMAPMDFQVKYPKSFDFSFHSNDS